MKSTTTHVVLWLAATFIAILMALLMKSAAFVDGDYIPVGYDSFYHARRILDAAIGERGFYQFDNMIHVPEGSWITWPWGYDYLMAVALSIALWIRPSIEPMAFLAHIPVAWLFVNMGLMTLIGRQVGLQPPLNAIALLGFALLPLTQTLHGVGIIDHHFIELTFVLATASASLKYFSNHARSQNAALLGITLGIAPAFHNGLFILQLPVLLCLLAWWVRGNMPDTKSIGWLAAALVSTTLIVALPSAPFREMQFEFWTLSWFHLYIAGCSAVGMLFMAFRPFRKLDFGLLLALGAILILPILVKISIGASFLSGDLMILDQIAEVRSPIAILREPGGLFWVTSFYSWLVFLAPILIAIFAVRVWRNHNSPTVCLSVFIVFGLALMLVQYRLHPFGAWALLIGGMLLAQESGKKYGFRTLTTTAVSLLILAVALQPPLQNRLLKTYTPANDVEYAASRSLFKSLAASCTKENGTVLSHSNDGHYIRYHTDCSVLTNNFLMTPLHDRKIQEADRMLQMDPDQFLENVPQIDYIFVRMYGIFEPDVNGMAVATPIPTLVSNNAPLFVALTFAVELPDEFVLIDEVRVEDDRDFAYARVFRIERD